METGEFSKLNFCWWNTSLSPRGKKRASDNSKSLECTNIVIQQILAQKKVDFLAIGEVSQENLESFKEQLRFTSFNIFGCHEKVGRGFFSQAYIYNSNKVNILTTDVLSLVVAGRSYRAGHSLVIETFDKSRFLIIVSHWPSKLQTENEMIRCQLATRIRDYCSDVVGSNSDNSYIVLMGDYNSEPFESPIAEFLMASRDRTKVVKKSDLFYNPYWKSLAMSECKRFCGSYFFKSGIANNWRLFDQIIFSSSLVDGDKWYIEEEAVELGLETVYELVNNSQTHFDHLPVFAMLGKKYE